VVGPGPLLILWTVLVLAVLVTGVVTAVKARRGWLLAGLLTGGLAWLISAFMPARPGSAGTRIPRRRRGDGG
jgi:hypothetical protein